jgi:hypothetical protein
LLSRGTPVMTQRPWGLLAALFAALGAVAMVWVSIDRRPPEWDHANHLERALDCYRILSEPGHARFREIMETSSFYPPVAPCAAGILYFVFPVVPLTAQAVMLGFLAVALAAVLALGRRLFDVDTGLLAAFFLGTAPFVVFSLTNFQLDLPLMAAVALALWALMRTEAFSRGGWSVAFGVALGLGMLTKPPFAAYVLPPALWALWSAATAADRRRRLWRLALALVIGCALTLPWYGPRLLGLPMQVANRSFKQAAESGHAEAFTSTALLYYPRVFQPQFGALAGLLFVWGLWALRRRREARAPLWLAAIVPLVMFSLIQNKNLRYTLPILPAAALVAAVGVRALAPSRRRALTWLCVVAGVVQVSMAAFGVPTPPRVPGLLLPLAIYQPPSRDDWQQDRILDDLMRESGGRPATVAVVPNYNFLSVSNLRYESARRGLPFRMTRAWNDGPLGVDFVVLKTASQGPSFSTAKPERIMRAFDGGDPYLARAFPVVAEYPLPDGTRAILRVRRLAALEGLPAARVAARLEEAPARLLARNVAEPVGLVARLDYRPDALLRGEVDRVQVQAESALVGELARRERPPLRVRDVRLEVDGLLFDARRLMEAGELEILGVRALRIQRLVVTEEDLASFLRGQRGGGEVSARLGDGEAAVVVSRLGPTISAAVRLLPGQNGSPFTLDVSRVRVAGIPVPGLLVNWIVRQFDPTPMLRRLPVEVSAERVSVHPGRIEVGP